jgi:hypothetical protein
LDADNDRAGTDVPAPEGPAALQILIAEHSSLSSARSLAYNEAFTRGDMFLGFLSMSLVALALISQASPSRDFLTITAVVLTFDLIVGLTTFGRILAAGYEDYVAVHGMARIRNAYLKLAPSVRPYVTSTTHDDLPGVMLAYGSPPTRGGSAVIYGLTTSSGMITLVLSMLAAVLAAVIAMLASASIELILIAAAAAFVVMLAGLGAATYRYYMRKQAIIAVLFPTPANEPDSAGRAARD